MLWYGDEERPVSYTSHMVRRANVPKLTVRRSCLLFCNFRNSNNFITLFELEFQFSAKQFPSFRPKVYSTNRENVCFKGKCEFDVLGSFKIRILAKSWHVCCLATSDPFRVINSGIQSIRNHLPARLKFRKTVIKSTEWLISQDVRVRLTPPQIQFSTSWEG